MSLELHFLQSHLDIFPGKYGSHQEMSADRAANGIQICWLITAGHLYRRPQQKDTRETCTGDPNRRIQETFVQETPTEGYKRHLYRRHQQKYTRDICTGDPNRRIQETLVQETPTEGYKRHLYRRHQQKDTRDICTGDTNRRIKETFVQ
jgi:hypothetical protein